MQSVAQASKPCSGDAHMSSMMAKRPETMEIHSNVNDNIKPPFFTLQSNAYNIPDGRENNAEIIRGEMMFFNTPLMEKYSQDSYNAIKNVQAQCSIDYQQNCATSSPFMQLHSMIEELFRPDDAVFVQSGRRLTEKLGSFKNGAELISYMRSFYEGPNSLQAHMDKLFSLTAHFQHPLSKVVWKTKDGKLASPEGQKDKLGLIEKDMQQKRIHTNVIMRKEEKMTEEVSRELTKDEAKETKAEVKAEKQAALNNKIGAVGGARSHVHMGAKVNLVEKNEAAAANVAAPAVATPTPMEVKPEVPRPVVPATAPATAQVEVEEKLVEKLNAAHKHRQLRSSDNGLAFPVESKVDAAPAVSENLAAVSGLAGAAAAGAPPKDQYAFSYDRNLPMPPRSAPMMIPGLNAVQPLSGFQKFILDFLFSEGVGINMATPDPAAPKQNAMNDPFALQVKNNAITMPGAILVGPAITRGPNPDFIIIGGPPSFLPPKSVGDQQDDSSYGYSYYSYDDSYGEDADDDGLVPGDDEYASNYYYYADDDLGDDAEITDDSKDDDGAITDDNGADDDNNDQDDYYESNSEASLAKDNKKYVPVGGPVVGGSLRGYSKTKPVVLGPVIPKDKMPCHESKMGSTSTAAVSGHKDSTGATAAVEPPIGKDSVKPRDLLEASKVSAKLVTAPKKMMVPGKEIKSLLSAVSGKATGKSSKRLTEGPAPLDPSPHPGDHPPVDPTPHPGHEHSGEEEGSHEEPPARPHPRPTPPQTGGDSEEQGVIGDSSEEVDGNDHHHHDHHHHHGPHESSEENDVLSNVHGPTSLLFKLNQGLRDHFHPHQKKHDEVALLSNMAMPPSIHPHSMDAAGPAEMHTLAPGPITGKPHPAPPVPVSPMDFLAVDPPFRPLDPRMRFGRPDERPHFLPDFMPDVKDPSSEEEDRQLGKDDHDYHDHGDKKRHWHHSSEEMDGPGPHHHHPHGPPPPPVPPDTSFQGYIGYGSDGDMCMYRSMAQGKVSDGCINAVQQVYVLRNEYWQEYNQQQMPPPHHHGLFFLSLLLFGGLVFVVAKKVKNAPRRKQLRSLLTSLHTNPALKAQVERETGIAVPTPMSQHGCMMTEYTGTNTANSCYLTDCCSTFIRGLAITVGLLGLALLVNFTSILLTMSIVNAMDKDAPEDPETGEPQLTSQGFTLFLLFSFITLQLVGIAALVRTCRRRHEERRRRREELAGSPTRHLLDGSEHGGQGSPVSAFHSVAPVSPVRQWFRNTFSAVQHWRRNGSVNDGYSSLPAEESSHGGSEMINMSGYPGAHSATARNVVTHPMHQHQQQAPVVQQSGYVAPQVMLQPQTVNGQTVLVPITARPVNAVSLV